MKTLPFFHNVLAAGVVMGLSGNATGGPSPAVTYTTVALAGQEAPGTDGARFKEFVTLELTASGDIIFYADLIVGENGVDSTNERGVWKAEGDTLSLLAREGSVAPGAGGLAFEQLHDVRVNSAGDVALSARLEKPYAYAQQESGIWTTTGGTLELLARTGSVAPGTDGARFKDFGRLLLSEVGDIVFIADLITENGVSTFNDGGIWKMSDGTLSLVAREGFDAPGIAGADFVNIGRYNNDLRESLRIDEAGDIVFWAQVPVNEIGVDATSYQGIWKTTGGTLDLLVRSGMEAPGTNGAFYRSIGSKPALNAAGDVAFIGFLEEGENGVDDSNSRGIWKTTDGELGLLVRAGSEAPGTGGAEFIGFSNSRSNWMNNAGDVAFEGFLKIGESGVDEHNRIGIWKTTGDSLALVAREDFDAPGSGGVEFSSFEIVGLSESGLLFAGLLDQSYSNVNRNNNEGSWLFSSALGDTVRIVREGDILNMSSDPGVMDPAQIFISIYEADIQPVNDTARMVFVAFLDGEFRFQGEGLITAQITMEGDPSPAVTSEWATVGHAGNSPDTSTGYGSVGYRYQIRTTEVTNSEYADFLNQVAMSDPYNLYNPLMSTNMISGGIDRSGADGTYTYTVKLNMGDKPVNYVSWYDAARMANWLTNGKGSGSTETGVYTFSGPNSISAITRDLSNPDQVFIPTQDEWFKAAYHQPGSQGGDSDSYWLYATQSNDPPIVATITNTGAVANPGSGVVNYTDGYNWNGSRFGNTTTVGSAWNTSFHGAFDLSGNVYEWNEGASLADPGIIRGGSFRATVSNLQAEWTFALSSTTEWPHVGIRFAAPASQCPADFNGDDKFDSIDIYDFVLAVEFLESSANIDGYPGIDFFDVASMLTSEGAICD